MRPLVAYTTITLAGAAGLASIFLFGGFGRAVGAVLLIGAAIGALVVQARPSGEARGRFPAMD
ncbi:hypothetical protein [Roseomonas populi]|uniref:Uncharacterized protein n=1 Tax=Roseomonas populi TaxID=3121582 RepID=A0ABT1X0E6_9PROT|nr:hypothetical protein [Roseomonas pecuniae]MCR0981568.1 hypothetical protein [Roseomonas pecuniae]